MLRTILRILLNGFALTITRFSVKDVVHYISDWKFFKLPLFLKGIITLSTLWKETDLLNLLSFVSFFFMLWRPSTWRHCSDCCFTSVVFPYFCTEHFLSGSFPSGLFSHCSWSHWSFYILARRPLFYINSAATGRIFTSTSPQNDLAFTLFCNSFDPVYRLVDNLRHVAGSFLLGNSFLE